MSPPRPVPPRPRAPQSSRPVEPVVPACLETGPDWPQDAVEVGRVADAFGIKGWVKVQPYAGQPDALSSARRWWVRSADDAAGLQGRLRVREVKDHGDHLVAQIDDVGDRDAALALKGWRLFMPRASFPTPEEGEYYWVDLIGLDVINRQDVMLGQVSEVFDTGANCVLRVVRVVHGDAPAEPGAVERLIPFVAAYIDQVDLPARRIRVDWLPEYD